MYNVSDEYLEKINSVSKQVYWYGKVTLTNGTVYEFDVSNMKQGQTKITKVLCNDNAIRLGGTSSAELKIAFMLDYDGKYYRLNGLIVDRNEFYDAKIKLTFRLYLDRGYEDVELGTFIVSEVERKQMVLTCTAYDYMQKFNKKCVSTISGLPYNVLLSACSICGVKLGTTVTEIMHMPNGKESIVMYDPKNQITTWRQVIGYVASMLCANAIIKADRKLYIIPITKGEQRTVGASNRVSLALEDYTNNFRTITAINLRTNTTDKVSLSSKGLTYPMDANPLIQQITKSARKKILRSIVTQLRTCTFTPFSGTFFCDPSFELGDTVLFVGNHAYDSTLSLITKMEISVSGHMTMGCDGENPNSAEAKNAASPSLSQETGGSTGDGVTFYDYVNHEDVNVTSEEQFTQITYESCGDYRQEFGAELELDVNTSDECVVTITYKINGVNVTNCTPKATYTDGKHLLHLMYFWDSNIRIEESTFAAHMSVSGGTVKIKNNYSRIMQSGDAYPEVSNELSYIDLQHEPDNSLYWLNQPLDYTGVKVVAVYEDGRTENITNQCTFSPANGSIATQMNYINVEVSYTEDETTFETSFAMEEILPEELIITPPTETVFFIGDTFDFTGLKIEAKFTEGTIWDVTDECTIKPADGAMVTSTSQSVVRVSYKYLTHPAMKDTFNVEVKQPAPVLKYLKYTTNVSKRTINVYDIDAAAISEDNLKNLRIPTTYTDPESGITFTITIP